jgi:energy-coupling factor transporter ATP-binding protein EcfA2
MLLAVARTGSACGLLLLDEVDAALDEVNQARASALLRQLAHDKASACQILCVTHNFSFQESCDGFVRVAKSAEGHSVPAEQGTGGGAEAANTAAAAASAAAAPGKGGSSKKGGKQGRGLSTGSKGCGAQGGVAGRAKRVRFAEGG